MTETGDDLTPVTPECDGCQVLPSMTCAIIAKMASLRIEPGLLRIFRLFLGVQLILILINLHVHSARGLLPGSPTLVHLVVFSGIAVQLAYLSWPYLRKTLGRFFLPVVLIFSGAFSLVVQKLFLNIPVSLVERSSEEAAWQLFLFLFVPLVLTGWQYGFRSVILYCLFTTLLDYGLVSWADPGYASVHNTYHRFLLIRPFSFLLAGYVVSAIMQLLRRERERLEAANVKLTRFVATLEELAASRERYRIARELHDTLAHTLSGMAIQLEAIDTLLGPQERVREMLQHCLRVTRDGLTEARRAITALRATPLEDLGLSRALREFAESRAVQTGAKLETDLPEDIEGVPPEVEQAFYRIGQEAIENVARHSQARSVTVSLSRGPGLRLEIADDGCGFDSRLAAEEGRGLHGMRERAEIIHGEIDILSGKGEGTRVVLSWSGEPVAGGR